MLDFYTAINKSTKTKVILDDRYIRKFKHHFYTISIHTSGKNPNEDVITKIAAVKYHNRKGKTEFYEKVEEANEEEVIRRFVEFIKDALNGKYGIYVTGYTFDIDFIVGALKKYGYDYNIIYVNYTSFSRKYLVYVDSFKSFVSNQKENFEDNLLGTCNANAEALLEMMGN